VKSGDERMDYLIDIMSSAKNKPKLDHDLHREFSYIIKHEIRLNESAITEEVKVINAKSLILVI